MIPVSCPQCGLGLQAPENAVGRKAKCRRCQTTFVITPAAAPPPPPEGFELPPAVLTNPAPPAIDPLADWVPGSPPPATVPSAGTGAAANPLDEFGYPDASAKRGPRQPAKSSSGGNVGALLAAVVLLGIAAAVWFLKPAPAVTGGLALLEMPPQTIAETRPYRVKISAGTTGGDSVLEIVEGPEGAVVDPRSGDLTWTPTEAQGPGEYTLSLVTKLESTGAVTSRAQLTLIVEELHDPPVFDKTEILDVMVGKPVTVKVVARDTDLPASPIVYALKGSKTSRTPEFNVATGEVTWTPEEQDAGKKLLVVIEATEQGGKNLATDHPLYFQVRPLDTPLEKLLARFRAAGAKIEPFAGFAEFDLKGETHALKVAGEELYVFIYDDPETAEEEAKTFQQDAARLKAQADRVGATVRFYRSDEYLAAYLGNSSTFLTTLESTLGRPFTEARYMAEPIAQRGRDPGDDLLLTLYKERDRRSKSEKLFSPFEYPAIRKIYAERFEKERADDLQTAFGEEHDEMMKWLGERRDFKESLFLAFDPQHDDIVAGLKIVKELKAKFPKQIDKYLSLVVATAVVWDRERGGVPDYTHHQVRTHSILPSGMLGAIENFQYLVEAEPVMQGRIQFVPWEFLVHVCNHKTPLPERQWAVANYVPRRVMFGKCYSDVPYDTTMLQTESKVCKLGGQEYTLPNILNLGGVCAMQADFAARVGKSIGAPSEYVGGASASGDLHAWVMWVELTAATPTSVAFTLQSHGRYRGDHYFVGNLRSPQTGQPITDRDLERRLNAVGTNAFNKRQADLVMATFPMIRDELKLDLNDQLAYLTQVTRLSPWNEEAWTEASRLATQQRLDKRGRTQLLAVMNQLFATFAPFPDFTLGVFPTLVQFEPEDKTRIQHYYKLLDMYAAANRPDLSFNALLILADILVANERQPEAIQALAVAVKKYADQGNYVPKMLDRLDSLCESPEHKAALVAFYNEFLPLIPTKRGNESSKYCMRMYERGILKFQEAGQPQLAQAYQVKLAELKAR